MKLPKVITDLIKAQDSFDSLAYANCFSETAEVYDEGKTHKGRAEIKEWIANANEKYKTVMKPLSFKEKGETSILTAENSGTFPASPVILKYNLEIEEGLIKSLKITL
ncbi:nuclear transport factor 2 family protein [Chitinophaga cymbidii]|uniref:Polyketide cyclase n=1 Tax=Chitinophaga cymbidii TaxID=1096750 RepID=A0A512REI9_9BACT|nr:nuclear transport factor 2 family protein [Chitinophaga cymbidii]GEP94044.1 polyketide cyclase [Chitinophaga cymbidii]